MLNESVDLSLKYLKHWTAKLNANHEKSFIEKIEIFKNCFIHIPKSFKIWLIFIKEAFEFLKNQSKSCSLFYEVDQMLSSMSVALPWVVRGWVMRMEFYCLALEFKRFAEVTKEAINSLPLTQHYIIWESAIDLSKKNRLISLYDMFSSKYIKLNPSFKEPLIDELVELGLYKRSYHLLKELISDDSFISSRGVKKSELWLKLLKLISSINEQWTENIVDEIFKEAQLNNKELNTEITIIKAEYYIRKNIPFKARQIFEDALEIVDSGSNFKKLFTAYLALEEGYLRALIEDNTDSHKISQQITKVEMLLNKRDILLIECLIKENPHNPEYWIKKFDILKEKGYDRELDKAFLEGLSIFDNVKRDLALPIWRYIGIYYQYKGEILNMHRLFSKALSLIFKNKETYIILFRIWIELLLVEGQTECSLALLEKYLSLKGNGFNKSKAHVAIQGSETIWCLYCDLLRQLRGRGETVKVYEEMMNRNLINLNQAIRYIHLVFELGNINATFIICEKMLDMFTKQNRAELWMIYLNTFISKNAKIKPEMIRCLFDRAISDSPPSNSYIISS